MRRWLPLVTVLLLGAMIGLGGFTFVYARGYSYLSDDVEVCGNCHVMDEHVAAWGKSSHKGVAVCNDCHTPHHPVRKYLVKARNGFWHSLYFTTGTYPYPLRITAANHEVTEETCRYCHEAVVGAIEHGGSGMEGGPAGGSGDRAADPATEDRLTCTRCHRYVGHWVR